MGNRRKARELVMQMLFQADVGRQTPEQVRKAFWAERSEVGEESRAFSEELFRTASERAAEIDGLIARHAEHWRLERMAAVDRNILRAGVAEFLALETPRPVVINEALEIARRFSAPESVHFINGVLDSIAREMTAGGNAQEKGQPEKGKKKKKLPS
jgi:N utilization substance protein B